MPPDGAALEAGGRLWAPWRIGFIMGPKSGHCFMCDPQLQDASFDKETLLLERGAHCNVIMNRYPYTNGHLLVAPRAHVADFTDLPRDTVEELGLLSQRWIGVLRDAMHPHGFNMGYNLGEAAGAGIAAHLHEHIVPRWNGDTNFMTVCGDVRLINQSLMEAWHLLTSVRAARDG